MIKALRGERRDEVQPGPALNRRPSLVRLRARVTVIQRAVRVHGVSRCGQRMPHDRRSALRELARMFAVDGVSAVGDSHDGVVTS